MHPGMIRDVRVNDLVLKLPQSARADSGDPHVGDIEVESHMPSNRVRDEITDAPEIVGTLQYIRGPGLELERQHIVPANLIRDGGERVYEDAILKLPLRDEAVKPRAA